MFRYLVALVMLLVVSVDFACPAASADEERAFKQYLREAGRDEENTFEANLMESIVTNNTRRLKLSLGTIKGTPDAGLDFYHHGRTPLTVAAQRGNREVVEMLLQAGATADLPDMFGKKPFEYAEEGEHHEIKRLVHRYVEQEKRDKAEQEELMKVEQLKQEEQELFEHEHAERQRLLEEEQARKAKGKGEAGQGLSAMKVAAIASMLGFAGYAAHRFAPERIKVRARRWTDRIRRRFDRRGRAAN